jgi:hypothetical protein
MKKVSSFQSCTNELCLLCRAALEANSELYDRLSRDSSVTAADTRYLVNFQQKISVDHDKIGETSNMKGPEEDKEEEEHLSDEYDEPLDPEEDWYAVGYLGKGMFSPACRLLCLCILLKVLFTAECSAITISVAQIAFYVKISFFFFLSLIFFFFLPC